VTAGPGAEKTPAAAGRGHLRASHAEREQVIDTLKAAFVQGRLSKDELDLRVGQTFASRTYAELAALTADIPAGLTAAPLPRTAGAPKRARAQPRPPMSTAAKAASCGAIAAATLVVATYLTDGYALFLFVPFYFMALLVAGAQILDSRHQKRTRGQLPPRPAQRGQALDGEQDGGIGNELILSAARRPARARHLPGSDELAQLLLGRRSGTVT
jgi:Domain of unknown function (DUF1707)